MCETCLKLIKKTPQQRHWCRSDVFIVNFENISHLVFQVFLLFLLVFHLRISSHLLKKSLLENFIFCAVYYKKQIKSGIAFHRTKLIG